MKKYSVSQYQESTSFQNPHWNAVHLPVVSYTWQPPNNMIFKTLREKVQVMKQSPISGANVKGLISLQRIKICTVPELALFTCFRQSGTEWQKPPAWAAAVTGCLSCSTTTDNRLQISCKKWTLSEGAWNLNMKNKRLEEKQSQKTQSQAAGMW